jgi:hypothetical protein
VVAISSMRSMSQPISTVSGDLELMDFMHGFARKDAKVSHCTPRLMAKFCQGRWCMRLSMLRTADESTVSTKERVQDISPAERGDEDASVLRNRVTSIARRSKSIRDCRARSPNLGSIIFEINHLRNIPYARMQLRILGGRSRYSVT